MHVDDGLRGASRVGGEQQSLEQPVGIALHQVPVLEDPGLAFLAVDDDVLRRPRGRAARRPFHRGLEVGAAAPREAGRAHLLDDALGPALAERPRERRVAAVAERVGDVARVGEAAALEQHAVLAREDTRAMLDSLLLHIGTAYETEIWGQVRKFIVLDVVNDLLALTIRYCLLHLMSSE